MKFTDSAEGTTEISQTTHKAFFFPVSRIRTFQGLLKSKKTDSKTNQYYHSSDLVNHRMTEMYLGWP